MNEETEMHNYFKYFIYCLVIFLAVIVVFNKPFFVVQAGEKALVFNSFSGLNHQIYGEGMHLKIPLIEKVIKMNTRIQKQSETATSASADLQDVKTEVAVNFQVDSSKLVEIYRQLGQSTVNTDYLQTQIMNPIIQESVKSVTAQYTAEQLISERPTVKQNIDDLIKSRLSKYNINVIDVSITDFKFSDQFTQAIEAKVTAEQNAQREQNNLKVVEYQAQQKVETAIGEANSTLIKARAESEAQNLQSKTITSEVLTLRTIEKWNGVLPVFISSSATPFINTDKFLIAENNTVVS